MKLEIANIGKIKSASIEINGITVIGGENNTGKSTMGKALYSIFNTFYDKENKLLQDKKNAIKSALDKYHLQPTYMISNSPDNLDIIAEFILFNVSEFKTNYDLLKKSLRKKIIELFDQHVFDNRIAKYFDNMVKEIYEYLSVSDDIIYQEFIRNELINEFSGQVCTLNYQGASYIKLTINNQNIVLNFENGNLKDIENISNIDIFTEAIYMDDPFLLDSSYSNRYGVGQKFNHREYLKNLILRQNFENFTKDIVTKEKLTKILSKISQVCKGDIAQKSDGTIIYNTEDSLTPLNFNNVSTGLKSFAILKTLIENNTVQQDGTIILDEPEIHLHPEWQLVFAELVVLLHKEFNINILLNTHSPYFLRAIQVYSAKHKVDQSCKYYLSDINGDVAFINDVSDDIGQIYAKLSRPLQTLSDEEAYDL